MGEILHHLGSPKYSNYRGVATLGGARFPPLDVETRLALNVSRN